MRVTRQLLGSRVPGGRHYARERLIKQLFSRRFLSNIDSSSKLSRSQHAAGLKPGEFLVLIVRGGLMFRGPVYKS